MFRQFLKFLKNFIFLFMHSFPMGLSQVVAFLILLSYNPCTYCPLFHLDKCLSDHPYWPVQSCHWTLETQQLIQDSLHWLSNSFFFFNLCFHCLFLFSLFIRLYYLIVFKSLTWSGSSFSWVSFLKWSVGSWGLDGKLKTSKEPLLLQQSS